jgi:hypothetical protein
VCKLGGHALVGTNLAYLARCCAIVTSIYSLAYVIPVTTASRDHVVLPVYAALEGEQWLRRVATRLRMAISCR